MSTNVLSATGRETKLENSSAEWIKFNKKHKSSWETVQVDGTPKIHWKCTCGEGQIVPANSGFIIGVKVMWRNHFEALKRDGKI
jgi:lysyl-tRNA synthetase class I